MTSIAQHEIHEKKLQGSKCARCGYVAYPGMVVCPKCGPVHSGEVKPFELPSVGAVVAWTRLQVAPKGFLSPLLHCIVDLGGVRIVGVVEGGLEMRGGERVLIAEDPMGRLPFIVHRPSPTAAHVV